MTPEQKRRIERFKNHRTFYELALIHTSGRRVLVAYCQSRSRRSLLDSARSRGAAVAALTGCDGMTFGTRAADGATMGEWEIRFTGRTRIEAILEGEHEYIGDIAAKGAVAA